MRLQQAGQGSESSGAPETLLEDQALAQHVLSKLTLLSCGLGLVLLIPSAASATGDGPASARTMQEDHWPRSGAGIAQHDRIEISDLLARYVLYADAADGAAFATVFTEDGELIFSGQTIKGRANLARHISGKTRRTLRLAGAPLMVQVSPRHVRVRSELLFIAEAASDSRPASQSMGFSVYDDDIVLTPQGWKFARREAGVAIPLGPEFLPAPDVARTRP